MLKYTIRRILQLIPILIITSVIIFLLVRVTPSDPIASLTKGKPVSDATREALTKEFYLDKSIPEQYLIWIKNIITRGELGKSYQYRDQVNNLLAGRLPTTLQIVLMSAVMALLIALPVGTICAVKQNSIVDRTLSILMLILVASPVFLTAIVFMLIFALMLHWFPSFGTGANFVENLRYLFLPSLALALNMVALIARITRSNMIEQINSDYTQTAVAKGMPFRKVITKHCFRNALIPVITIVSIQFGGMIVGAVLVEEVFALGGVGDLLTSSIKASDYPVTQSIVLMMVTIYLVINLLVDLLYAVIDPRIRLK